MGSSKSSIGPGPVAGAGETIPKGPGPTVKRAGMKDDMYPSASTPSGKGKVPNHTRGQEEG